MRLQLKWIDPNTQQVRMPALEPPIAFGSEFGAMPSEMQSESVRRMVLAGEGIIPFHAILAVVKGNLALLDRQDGTGTLVNGTARKVQVIKDGDRITIGPFEITVTILSETALSETAESPVDPFANTPDPFASPVPVAPGLVSSVGSSVDSSVGFSEGVMGLAAGGANGTNGVNNSTSQADAFAADGMCSRKVGFLFKRRCGRTTTQGCPDCQNGQIDPGQSRYQDDYAFYSGYGRYGRGYWGHNYYHNRHHYHYDPHSRNVDFNESDAASFEQEGDNDYEMDLDAS